MCRFPCKIALHLKKVCCNVYVNIDSYKIVWHSLAYLTVQFMVDVPFRLKLLPKLTHPLPFKNADFQSIFANSASALTPSEISSINTNRKIVNYYPTFPMSLRLTAYTLPLNLNDNLR